MSQVGINRQKLQSSQSRGSHVNKETDRMSMTASAVEGNSHGSFKNALGLSEVVDHGKGGNSQLGKRPRRKVIPELSVEDKQQNAKVIRNMNTKISFLKNPRFRVVQPPIQFTDLGTTQGKELPLKSKQSMITVKPEQIIFWDFQIDKVYEINLVVTNTDTVSRRIKHLPPLQKCFSIKELKYPTPLPQSNKDEHHFLGQEVGMVAPGMSVVFVVQFYAHNFQEQLDSITLVTESSSFKIPVEAKRSSPQLMGLPQVIDCKSCWIGDRCTEVFKVTNKGGDCGFRFFPENEHEESPESDNDILKIGNFEIYPREFYMQQGDIQEIVATYTPSIEGQESKKIVLVCDNRSSAQYILKGGANMAEISIYSIDDLTVSDYGKESQSMSRIFFEGALPGIRKIRTLRLKNETDVVVKFHWDLFKKQKQVKVDVDNKDLFKTERSILSIQNDNKNNPEKSSKDKMKPANQKAGKNNPNTTTSPTASVANNFGSIFQQDVFCFSIKPQTGVFQPRQIISFEVSFLTNETNPIFEDATLFIDDIPFESIRNISQHLLSYMKDKLSKPSPISSNNLPGFIGSNSPRPSISYLNLSFVGLSSYAPVSISKPFKMFSYPLTVHQQNIDSFELKNNSESLINYSIVCSYSSQPNVKLSVDKEEGQLQPNQSINIQVIFSCDIVCERQEARLTISFDISHSLSYDVGGSFYGPIIRLHQPILDFGLMRSLETKSEKLILENASPVQASISIRDINEKKKQQVSPSLAQLGQMSSTGRSEIVSSENILEKALDRIELMQTKCNLEIGEKTLILQPYEKREVSISCKSGIPESYTSTLEIEADHSKDKVYINVKAEVQKVCVSLSRISLDIPCLYADKLYIYENNIDDEGGQFIQIQNLGNIDAHFEWETIKSDLFRAEFLPKKGIVKAKSTLDISLSLTAFGGDVLDHIFVCEVQDVKYLLGFQVKTPVYGLAVTIEELIPFKQSTSRNKNNQNDSKMLGETNMFNTLIMKSNVKNSHLSKTMRGSDSFKSFEAAQKLTKNTQKTSTVPDIENCERVKIEKLEFFGCLINQPKHIYLVISNTSGISTKYKIYPQNFLPFKPKASTVINHYVDEDTSINKNNKLNTILSEQSKSSLHKNKMIQKETHPPNTALLTAEIEKTQNFNSRGGQELNSIRKIDKEQRFYLQNDKGFAILCEPSEGSLDAHQDQLIKVTVFNDISGKVDDFLLLDVEGLEQKKIPLEVDVSGSPIIISSYQLGVNYKGPYPIFDLGSYMKNGVEVEREFKIQNTGPKTVKINWKMYNLAIGGNQSDQDFFNIKVEDPVFGSGQVCKIKFDAISPPEATTGPFFINPKEVLISGREEKSFKVTFMQKYAQDFVAVLIAEPAMLKKDGTEETDIKLEQLILGLQAHTLKPKLYIDKLETYDGKQVLKLEKWALFDNRKQQKEICLVNQEFVTVKFDLIVEGPFQIKEVNTSSKTNILNSMINKQNKGFSKTMRSDNMHNNQSIMQSKLLNDSNNNSLPLTMTYTLEQNTNMKLILLYEKEINSDWPMTYKNYEFGKLTIKFTNGDEQTIELEGHLLRPLVTLNTSGHEGVEGPSIQDFGIVNIADSKKITLFLSNSSKVPAKWKIHHIKNPFKKFMGTATMTIDEKENNSITDDQDVFQFSVTEGLLHGPSIPVKSLPDTLSLPTEITTQKNQEAMIFPQQIKPKKNVMYKSKYRICVDEGPTVDFLLRGIGTYDEELQNH